ncbi:MAG: type I DNA topoisomerase [Bacteroidales bacterium]|jgi:DNA topoisomerase-1|nr:type I DNA topoisomerase [Bacteroidales bacterium]
MSKNLVIVESPAKAKTIEKFLGKDYTVKSSMGHIRDLPTKKLGVDIAHDFAPLYEILSGKTKIINELKSDAKKADMVWLATDEDREGEAISWHLKEALGLKDEKTKRIAFHEITKSAIINAIENPRELDVNLVNAQQARRVLDRLVGFELSPVLWRKVKPALSAGRVQSVAVRLVVEREKEIHKFQSTSAYRVIGDFMVENGKEKAVIQAELNTRFPTETEALSFLEKCKHADFTVDAVEKRPTKKTPAPPFTTSTLQQEAARKLGFSVSRTMSVAQQLYELGYITYMRTDSVNLSDMAIAEAKKEIVAAYGKEYTQTRKYTTKTKGAQEAHEAIRPSYIDRHTLSTGDNSQKRLYELIWKRTIASQMSDAKFEKTIISITVSTASEKFVTVGETLLFDGFLKVYMESHDDEENNNEPKSDNLPLINQGMVLPMEQIQAVEKFSLHPARYTEASLVRKLEELGIGRPSTYAPTISTIQKRQYITKGEKEGVERKYRIILLKKDKITQSTKTEKVGAEKGKLYPTDIGTVVNDFLILNFENVMNYNFTAKVEKEFDDIADGKIKWEDMIRDFYAQFHQTVETATETSNRASGERLLGTDPASGKNIYVKLGRFGSVAQLGESNAEEKPQYAKLLPSQNIETLSLEAALELFKWPRSVGVYNGEELLVNVGRYGPYVRHGEKFYSIDKTEDLKTISVERCIELIEQKKERDAKKAPVVLGMYNNLEVSAAEGRYGPYVLYNKRFYALPADADVKKISMEEALELIKKTEEKNTIRTFTEDADVKILKGKYGPYIVQGEHNYKIPKSDNPMELTYQDCLDIIKKNDSKSTKAATKTAKAATKAKKTVTKTTKTATKTKK